MKNKRGITLVSLVVTIIVLIILAGVSINLTLGENGIITMAKKARENMEIAKVDEKRQLNELYEQIKAEGGNIGQTGNNVNNTELIEFKQKIAKAITEMGVETSEMANADTMASNIKDISLKNAIPLKIVGTRTDIYASTNTHVADITVTVYNNETNSVIATNTVTEGRDSYTGVSVTTEINGKNYTFKVARKYIQEKYFFTIVVEDENNQVLASNAIKNGSRDSMMTDTMYFNVM